jgi:hypothetical protein
MSRPALPALDLFGLIGVAAASPARAQGGVGLRGGLSVNPDQFYVGLHVDAGPLVDRLWFRPNVEIGLGANQTLFAFNAELAYWFPTHSAWRVYVGGGPALNIYHFDGGGRSDTRAGLNLLLGFAHHGGFFAEAKLGALDSPTLKLGIGYSFH